MDMGIKKIRLFLKKETAFSQIEYPRFSVFVDEVHRRHVKRCRIEVREENARILFDVKERRLAAAKHGLLLSHRAPGG